MTWVMTSFLNTRLSHANINTHTCIKLNTLHHISTGYAWKVVCTIMGAWRLVYGLILENCNHRGPENTAEKHERRHTSSVTDPYWRHGVACVYVEPGMGSTQQESFYLNKSNSAEAVNTSDLLLISFIDLCAVRAWHVEASHGSLLRSKRLFHVRIYKQDFSLRLKWWKKQQQKFLERQFWECHLH